MTAAELCAKLGVDRKQLAAWIKEGLPRDKKGRGYSFDEKAIAAWIASRDKSEASPAVLRTREEVARHFKVSTRTVATWIGEGMPGTSGSPGRQDGNFPVAEIQTWVDARRTVETGAAPQARWKDQARLSRARAEKIEFELAVKRGEFVPAEEVERRLTRHIFEACTQLGPLPGRVAKLLPDAVPAKVRARIVARVKRAIDAARSSLEQSLMREAEEVEAALAAIQSTSAGTDEAE